MNCNGRFSLYHWHTHLYIDTPTKMILFKWIESFQRNAEDTNQMFGTKTTIFRGLKSCNAIPMKLMLIYLRRMNIQSNDHTENRINIIQWIQRIHEKHQCETYFTSSQTDSIKPNHVHVHVHVLWITNHAVELRIFHIKKYFGIKERFIFKLIRNYHQLKLQMHSIEKQRKTNG